MDAVKKSGDLIDPRNSGRESRRAYFSVTVIERGQGKVPFHGQNCWEDPLARGKPPPAGRFFKE